MLKFNIKEHELEELKKYNFSRCCNIYHNVNFNFIVSIVDDTFSINNDFYLEDEDLCLLYDLIKDGLIVKE